MWTSWWGSRVRESVAIDDDAPPDSPTNDPFITDFLDQYARAMTHTVITLRARSCGIPPRPGDLMAAQTGNAVYRVDAVTTLHQAGERPGNTATGLTCTLLTSSELIAAYEDSSEEGFEIHPWRWGGHAPRQTAL